METVMDQVIAKPEVVAEVGEFRRGHDWTGDEFIAATVTLTDGSTLGVSQYPAEAPQWGVDSLFRGNGYPVWCHGEGARYLRVRAVAEDVAAYLNALRDKWLAEQN